MKLAMTPPLVSRPNDVRAVADEVAQPADDLLLDERGERPGMPDVDALVGDLGQELAHDRHRQRWRGEVAELARVLAVHEAAREAGLELVEDRGGGGRVERGGRGPIRAAPPGPKKRPRASAYGDGSPIARCIACP